MAGQVSKSELDSGVIYPPLSRIGEVSAAIAISVAKVAYSQNLAKTPEPENILAYIKAQMYVPEYQTYI